MERKYSVPSNPESRAFSGTTSEDLHAWSIYRQNLNSDFTDSALGSTDKSPLPYGNFQLRDTTVQSILSHPRYGPKSALGSNMYTYLKFGLPRVFPPNHNGSNRSATPQQHFIRNASTRPNMRGPKHASRGIRDGSSGYDSSDNETANPYKNNRKYRSDPDFRMQNFHSSYHIQQGGSPAHAPSVLTHQSRQNNPQWNRNKSISEANLLSVEYGTNKCHPIHSERGPLRADPRRNSVAEFGQHLHHHEMVDHGAMSNISRPMSKSESQFSVPVHRKGASLARSEYLAHEDQENVFLYPHLQVVSAGVWPENTSCFDSKPHLLLNDISFEARGGEILAIMSTSEKEGTALLDVIAGKTKPVLGEVILNGQHVKPRTLKNRVAYVQNNPHLCKDITALQTMHYHFSLKKPTDKLGYLKIDALDRINVLLEDLGLDQVRNTRVSSMTLSERRRLNVACHLLLDTDIVILDQPTKGMDIFDTFFLVEYLKQWANGGTGTNLGRIVILTLHPPTYEIFTMLSRILLISAGRTMFSGRRRDMLPYFALVDYPCPSYKNPSDYYLDLVTLDDLSAEAMLESSQRIEQLAEIFRQKQEPMSDPGPPSALPMTVQPSNSFIQATTLFMKAMSYSQPNTFLNWLTLIVIAASLSLINGAIFWDLPNTDNQLNLNDRLGYHYSVMTITCWPLLILLTCVDIMRNRNTIERDISDGLYGRFTYIFTKTLLNLFPSLFIWLIYIVPSYSMSGLYMQSTTFVYEGFYNYIGLMLLYLSSLQIFLTAFVYTISCPNTSAILSSIILTILFTISGFLVHLNDLPFYVKNLRYISPLSWLLPYFINRELSSEAIAAMSATNICRNKQVQHQDIIIQQPCPTPNGTQVLFNFNYLSTQGDIFEPDQIPILLIIFYFFLFIICTVSFIMQCCKSKKSSTRGENCANKP